MVELVGTIAAVLGAVGIGGVFGALLQHRLESKRRLGEQEHEVKQRRYMCILILMLAKLNPEIGIAKVRKIRPDLPSLDDLDYELETELLNGVVFAGADVLAAFGGFLQGPSHRAFALVADAMRRDLWGRRQRLDPNLVEMLAGLAARDSSQGIVERVD